MNKTRWLAGAVLAAALGVGGWFGYQALTDDRAARGDESAVSQILPDRLGGGSGIESVDAGQAGLPTGGTPMAERVAVVGLLNKRNNVSQELEMSPGESRRVGDVIVRLQTCERTAPWELPQELGAFVQVLVLERGSEDNFRKIFSGWLFENAPSVNVVEHPIYDVWVKDCTMRFPGEEGPASPKDGSRDDGAAKPSAAPSASPTPSPAARAAAPAPAPAV